MFTFEFSHRLFSGPSEQVPAMNRVKSLIRAENFSGKVFPFSKGYAAWETDEVSYSCVMSPIVDALFFIKKLIWLSYYCIKNFCIFL
jgi:hypothetical protein